MVLRGDIPKLRWYLVYFGLDGLYSGVFFASVVGILMARRMCRKRRHCDWIIYYLLTEEEGTPVQTMKHGKSLVRRLGDRNANACL